MKPYIFHICTCDAPHTYVLQLPPPTLVELVSFRRRRRNLHFGCAQPKVIGLFSLSRVECEFLSTMCFICNAHSVPSLYTLHTRQRPITTFIAHTQNIVCKVYFCIYDREQLSAFLNIKYSNDTPKTSLHMHLN